MPHVKKDTYSQAHQSEHKLQFVEVFLLVKRRTPYANNCFPVETLVLHFDDAVSNYYLELKTPAQSNNVMMISWSNYQNQGNPFRLIHNSYNGTRNICEISSVGLEDSH
ncbi:hypothetical protein KL936_000784 [Ogataea polymorpha]|nr:hypothetical protein KL936_000784 [Ogataea polymorpha]